jgi:hypothetical protein
MAGRGSDLDTDGCLRRIDRIMFELAELRAAVAGAEAAEGNGTRTFNGWQSVTRHAAAIRSWGCHRWRARAQGCRRGCQVRQDSGASLPQMASR